jgi:hypothetical protein
MRIAQIAPLAESVPPKLYGGTERVIAWLTDELIDLGHQVTLFASGDSATRAELVAVWPRALRLGRPRTDPMAAHAALLEAMAQRAGEFDIIHCHIDWTHLPLLSRNSTLFVTTFHGRLDLPGLSSVVQKFPAAPFVSISDNQRLPLKEANLAGPWSARSLSPAILFDGGVGTGTAFSSDTRGTAMLVVWGDFFAASMLRVRWCR